MYSWEILILEDNTAEMFIITHWLKSFVPAENITQCTNVDDAFAELHKEDKKYKNTPVIVTTSSNPKGLVTQTMKPIVCDYIIKPVRKENIEEALKKAEKIISNAIQP